MKNKKDSNEEGGKIKNFFLNTVLPTLLIVYLIMLNIVWFVKLTLSLGDLGKIIFVIILMVEVPIVIFTAMNQHSDHEKSMLGAMPQED